MIMRDLYSINHQITSAMTSVIVSLEVFKGLAF